MNENIEFDITVDGKQVKRSLKDIKKDLSSLDKKSQDTTDSMKQKWDSVGKAIKAAGIAAILQQTVSSALQLEKATFGLTDSTKEYIKVASRQYGLNQEIIAGFVQTGKSAGMSGDSIQEMIEQAVALSRAYPHESVETFIDNLSMLNTTGEAQGYIVDVLEQKWGAIDLKSMSLAEKMDAIREATKGVNEKFEETRAAKFDAIFQEGKTAVSDLGDTFLDLADSTGAMSVFSKGVVVVQYSLGGLKAAAKAAKIWVKGLFGADTTDDMKSFNEQLKENEELWKKIAGVNNKTPREQLKKPMLQDIKGSTKPKEQKDIEAVIKAEKEKQKAQEKASKEEAKRLMKVAGLKDRFNDDYIRTIEGDTELEMVELDRRYAEYDKHIEDKKKLNEWYSASVVKLYEEEDEEAKKRAEEIKTVFQDAFKGAEDSMVDFVMNGKSSMKDLFNSILEGLLRMQIRNSITQPLMQGLGAMFGGGTAATFHSGYIPSHHDGSMRSDERIAKLQVGESVISRHGTSKNRDALAAINRGEKVGGGNVVVNIENNSGTDVSQDNVSTSQDGSTMVVNVVLDAIARNKGGMRDSIKGVR